MCIYFRFEMSQVVCNVTRWRMTLFSKTYNSRIKKTNWNFHKLLNTRFPPFQNYREVKIKPRWIDFLFTSYTEPTRETLWGNYILRGRTKIRNYAVAQPETASVCVRDRQSDKFILENDNVKWRISPSPGCRLFQETPTWWLAPLLHTSTDYI